MPICYLPVVNTWTPAEFYRLLHTGNPGDIDFYCGVADEAERVLEMGCGWGRITAEIARAGRAVSGVDHDRALCEQARQALTGFPTAQVIEGDIRHLDLLESLGPGTFDRVIIPYNTLFALGGAEGAAACFRVARDSLKSDGELWFDVYPMDAMQDAIEAGEVPPEDDDEPVAEFDTNRGRVIVVERSILDHRAQCLEVSYEARNEEGVVLTTADLRHDYLLLPDLNALLAAAGFELTVVWGGFDGRPYDEDADQLILGATAI